MGQISELRRRGVFRMGMLYLAAAWLLLQVIDLLIDRGPLPEALGPLSLTVLAIGFPIALLFSWFFEITSEGISLETECDAVQPVGFSGRRIDFIVIAVLAAAVLVFGYDKWWPRGPIEHSIAVLPFANMSNDTEQEYVSDGIAEDILNLLVQVPELKVISRSSAFSFKGQNLDIPTIAAKLKVTHVLEGSVRRSGDTLRVTAQLIEVETDTHLWSENFDREFQDVFAIQDEIAAAVVDTLKIKLLGDEPKSVAIDAEAYALYLQGRHLWFLWTDESVKRAETLTKQALAMEPDFAPGWAQLAAIYLFWAVPWYGEIEGRALLRETIQQALVADPRNSFAHIVLARYELDFEWDFAAAAELAQQILALDPGDATVMRQTGWILFTVGRFDEAIALTRRSIKIDPLRWGGYSNLSWMLYCAHRLEEAANLAQTALSLNPTGRWLRYLRALVLLAQGDAPAALVEIGKEPAQALRLHGTAVIQHALGNAEASDEALRDLMDCCASEAAIQVAAVYAYRGENDHAFDWLDHAYEQRAQSEVRPGFLRNPWFANLHDDPRWQSFLDETGLPR